MKELNNVPMYNTEDAASRLYRYAMDHPTYQPDENQHEPNWEAYEAAEVLYRYAQGTAVDMEDLYYALELDKALQDEGIFYNPDEEQSSDEVQEFTFWFNR